MLGRHANKIAKCLGIVQGPKNGLFYEMTKESKTKRKPGPKPKRVKIEGDWETAVKKALKKPKGKK